VRVATWRDVDWNVVLERPPAKRSGLRGIGRLASLVAPRRVRLDDIGSFSWKQLDGATTVGEVCRQLRERFGERVEPVEEPAQPFLHSLRGEGFLFYREEGRRTPGRGGRMSDRGGRPV
jgi:hypothetical protein